MISSSQQQSHWQQQGKQHNAGSAAAAGWGSCWVWCYGCCCLQAVECWLQCCAVVLGWCGDAAAQLLLCAIQRAQQLQASAMAGERVSHVLCD
jgi:hypothetical protein